MSLEPAAVLRELIDWCRSGEQRFAAALAGHTATADRPEPRQAGIATPSPLWALEMRWHTDIPISKLRAVFRGDGSQLDLADEPDWRTDQNAPRLRCIATLTLMAAQLVSARDQRPGGVPLAELEERCRAFPSVTAPSGELKRTLRRKRVSAAYRIHGTAPTVSLTWQATTGPRILTPEARDACAWSVNEFLSVKRS